MIELECEPTRARLAHVAIGDYADMRAGWFFLPRCRLNVAPKMSSATWPRALVSGREAFCLLLMPSSI